MEANIYLKQESNSSNKHIYIKIKYIYVCVSFLKFKIYYYFVPSSIFTIIAALSFFLFFSSL